MTATPLQFFHGSQVIEGTQAIQSPVLGDQAAVGLIGTAPLANLDVFPLNEPVLLTNPNMAASIGATGTLPQAIADIYNEAGANVVVINVAANTDLDTQLNNVIGSQSSGTGIYGFLQARSLLGVQPKTLIAPGFVSQRVGGPSGSVGANPVVSALVPIAESLRGRIYASTPSDYADALLWASDFGSDRVVAFYPNVLAWSTAAGDYINDPAEATMAGLLAWVQQNKGFWWSPSNQQINVGGVSTPVDWDNSYTCLANLLNSNKIATIINMGQQTGNGIGGWRRWGNLNLSSNTSGLQFECVRTTCDAIYDALDNVALQWVDADPTPQTLADMTYAANQFFQSLKNEGIIVGGQCWLDPNDNNAQQMANGIYCWRIDPTPAAPMQDIVYYSQLNDAYYTQELNTLTSLINTNNL